MPDFNHLHCHTQYSLLDGASEIGSMMNKAKEDGQTAVAMTDHGNMYGAFKFVAEATKRGIKPIVGCEFYLVDNRHKRAFIKSNGEKDKRYHQLMLAKNRTGYENLCKLCSLGFMEGLYGKFPRIDKELVERYHEGLIVTSCCIGAIIPQTILAGHIEKAEEELKWWLNIFGDDFYIELQRHRGLDQIDDTGMSQEDVNQVLLGFAKKHDVKVIATNDSHYVEEDDWAPHDILLCVNTASYLTDEKRFKFPSSDFYFKKKHEMEAIFGDVPYALDNTIEISDKVETLELARDVLLPNFPIPPQFKNQEEYLQFLTFEGAKKRYPLITAEIEERLNFELSVINNSGYPGYFLIVQDFTTVARDMGVSVGPGRGSAAGSAVAYCLGITNIDPIKYDLLFERFLNPERISMPDIDIDFDDEGRAAVIDYVIDKYGQSQVAQIITYGTMAAKSSLRDVGRVMQVHLSEVDVVAKTFPLQLGATLRDVLAEKDIAEKLKGKMNQEDVERAYKFRKMAEEDNPVGEMIRTAKKLEGSIRNTGIHACGVVITPDDITNYVPVTVAKDSDLLVSQFDNSVAEDAGLLKMDFLGLRTLTIIKDAVKMVKETKGMELIPDEFPLDDEETYELFQRGETIGVFQYESPGMQKHLQGLKPSVFGDLIAMNALYRPGPLQYIPDFIDRKHGKQEITYDLADMEEYLAETYGITVYQEQVMLLSQKLANFSKGEADMLRKAMGKKKKKLIDQMWPKFLEGCESNGHDKSVVEKIWKDWEAFASYAFNKSHSTCYAFVAFQTAYLKAHYPSEFMASVLNHNKSDISKLNFFLRECKRMKIKVQPPDINESYLKFSVDIEGNIRFGLSALKGVGEGPVEEIINTRKDSGKFEDVYDMARRLNLRSVNKKSFESLVLGGAMDQFQFSRATYFTPVGGYNTAIEWIVKYGNAFQIQQEQNQVSLFGNSPDMLIDEPRIQDLSEWDKMIKLEKEKEVTGIYISGHPLDDYKLELKNFTTHPLDVVERTENTLVKVAGIVTESMIGISQRGTSYARFTIQDYRGSLQINLYNEQCEKWKSLVTNGKVLYVEGLNQKGYSGDRLFFKAKEIKMLDTVGQLLTKSVTIKFPSDQMNRELVDAVINLCQENEGKHHLKFKIVDREEDMMVDLISASKKVNANFEFVQAIEKLGLPYKLN